MKQQTKLKIENSKNLGEFLDTLNSEFDCVNCKPGKLTKDILIRTLISKVKSSNVIINESVRTKALASENVSELIKTIKTNFNVKEEFSEGAKKELLNSAITLTTLVKLKEK